MEISKETTELILEIDNYSEDFIKNNFEMCSLIELARSTESDEYFKKIIFTGKYLHGLRRILSEGNIGDAKAKEKIEYEFKTNFDKLIRLLKKITGNADLKTREYFNKKYFGLNQESLLNLMELLQDLALTKKYFNYKNSL